ncbi:MAG: DUF4259 domain-containing protein [Erythrobacter sp.]|uniref:DUF4259 domain-containing protein n=1 Tax=Erythrobacter sp. TaxID=1042 RepID=UPI003263AC80
MGAWGPGSFDNDDAMDFAGEITSPEDLLGPLTLESPEHDIDAELGCRIIVVAECVAAMRGFPSPHLPDALAEQVTGFGRPSQSLYLHARDHLAAVLERGELLGLWSEGDPSEFVDAVHELIGRLNRRASHVPPGPTPKKKPFYEEEWFKQTLCCFCNTPLSDAEFASVDAKINDGQSSAIGFSAWAHLDCLNRALHHRYRMRPFSMHPEDVGEDDTIFEVLDARPTLED